MDELNPRAIPQNTVPTPATPPPMPQQGTVPPPPPAMDVRVRTMESDAQAVARGMEPAAQPVTPPPMASIPTPIVAQAVPAPAPLPVVRESRPGRLFLWLIMFILVIGMGWGTYEYVLPIYRAMTPNAPEAPTQPAAPTPSPAGLATPPTPVPPPPPPAITPLGAARDTLPKIETDGTAPSIAAALAAEATKTKSASGTVEQVAIMNGGAPMSFDAYINALLPEAKTNGLESILTSGFDPVFSAYIYYDDRGAWPGYIAKINPAAQIDPATLASRVQAIETSSYKNFFLADPGTPEAFRTGQARDKYIDRFIPLSADGALFNYGIFGDYLIINTSNNGLVKALDLLKL